MVLAALALVAGLVLPVVADEPDAVAGDAVAGTTSESTSPETLPEEQAPEEVPAQPEVSERPPTTRPSIPSPVATVGPTEGDFENAGQVREELTAFIAATRRALEEAEEGRESVEREINDLSARLDAVVPGTQEADQFHEVIVDRLKNARQKLQDALGEIRKASSVPSNSRISNVSARRAGQTGEEWARLVDEIERLRKEAEALEDSLRWTNLALAGEVFHRLSALRTVSFGQLSLDKRDQIFGTSREGLEQLVGELRHVGLAARYYVVVRAHDIELAPAMTRDFLTLGELGITLLRLGLVLAIALFLKSRWRNWLHESRGPLFRWFRSINARRRLERLLGLLEVALPWLLLLVTLPAVEWALGERFQTFEVDLALSLLYYYGTYRLAIDLVTAGILRVSTHYELSVSKEREALAHASVVTFFRVIFGLAILGLLSRSLLGGGYLSQLASRFGTLVVAITLLVLMLRWRRELADAFLSKHPEGRIGDLVRRTRDTWMGVFVAPASLLWILGRALAVLAKDFAMGFEQTQRALAFLFRRRIEKEAERRGYAAGDIDALPERCREAFSEDAIDKGPGLVECFEGLDDLRRDLSIWREREEGRSFLLTGQRGVGKTSWLRQIRRDDVRVDNVGLGVRATSRDQLCQVLADRLDCPDPTFEGFVRHLLEGEQRVVVLDDAQHLFLATVDGYEAWAAFTELINRTKRRVFWICAMSAYAWKHLRAVRSDWTVFSRHQHLESWNEERIRELLRARMKSSGLHYNYSSLVLDRLEGVSSRDHLIESAEGYARLLWDYADGNPRVALHYFLHSLDQESENRLKVRLFRAPEVEKLDAIGETAMFILACVVEHESISAPHLAEATRYPHEIVRINLDKFLVEGVLREDEGLYRITTHWHRAVVRTLRRRNILTV